MKVLLVLLSLFAGMAVAQTQKETKTDPIVGGMDRASDAATAAANATATANVVINGSEEPLAESTVNREPAQDSIPGKPAKEDELRVLPQLPDAQLKTDAHWIQNEVYKTIYKRELKPDQREDVLDE